MFAFWLCKPLIPVVPLPKMVHTFSGCILGSAVECDLDELLATRLVSFLLDHQERILAVPEYLLSAISNHIQHLRTVQVSFLHPRAFGAPVDPDDGGENAEMIARSHVIWLSLPDPRQQRD